MVFPLYGYQNLLPWKLGFLAHKQPNSAKTWLFWPNIGFLGPVDPMPNQKSMRTRCLGGFSVTWVPKLLLPPVRLVFGQIWPKVGIFGHFWPNVGIFGPFCPMPDQKTIRTRCLGVFSVMRVPKLLLSPVKNLAQNWYFWSFWARPGWLIWFPVGGLVGGCGARAVSCKTPIYFL